MHLGRVPSPSQHWHTETNSHSHSHLWGIYCFQLTSLYCGRKLERPGQTRGEDLTQKGPRLPAGFNPVRHQWKPLHQHGARWWSKWSQVFIGFVPPEEGVPWWHETNLWVESVLSLHPDSFLPYNSTFKISLMTHWLGIWVSLSFLPEHLLLLLELTDKIRQDNPLLVPQRHYSGKRAVKNRHQQSNDKWHAILLNARRKYKWNTNEYIQCAQNMNRGNLSTVKWLDMSHWVSQTEMNIAQLKSEPGLKCRSPIKVHASLGAELVPQSYWLSIRDSFTIILLCPTTSTESSGYRRTELVLGAVEMQRTQQTTPKKMADATTESKKVFRSAPCSPKDLSVRSLNCQNQIQQVQE